MCGAPDLVLELVSQGRVPFSTVNVKRPLTEATETQSINPSESLIGSDFLRELQTWEFSRTFGITHWGELRGGA